MMNQDVIVCCVIADYRNQIPTPMTVPTPVPTTPQPLSRNTTIQWKSHAISSQVSVSQSVKNSATVRPITAVPSTRSNYPQAMPRPVKTVLSGNEPPVLSPKARDQVQHISDSDVSNGDDDDVDDDDDIYKYPKQPELRSAAWPGYQQSDEVYDTPPLRQHESSGSEQDTDPPPVLYRDEVEHYATDDIYDVPPVASSNIVANDCARLSTDGDNASHHSYVNTRWSTAESDASDPAEHYEVVVSAKTRSFRSTISRYVL